MDGELERWIGRPLTIAIGARLITEIRRLRAELEQTREELAEAQHYLGLACEVIKEDVQDKRRHPPAPR